MREAALDGAANFERAAAPFIFRGVMARDPVTGKFPPRPGKPASGMPAEGALYGASGAPMGADRLIPGAYTSGNLAAKAQRVEALLTHLEHLAFKAQAEAVQVNAAVAALKHMTPDANAKLAASGKRAEEMTDDELAAIASGGVGNADPTPGDTRKPN
jgi:hypothetical protein